MKKHSVGWNVAKMLTKRLRFHKAVNIIFAIIFLLVLLIAAFAFFGGK